MTDPTYGDLVNRAGCSLARAMATVIDTSRADDVIAVARGLDVLRHAIRRHAELAADPWRSRSRHHRRDEPADTLAAVLQPSWLPTPDTRHVADEAGSPWLQAGRYLGAASDLLATHLGPAGRHLTADARRFVDADGRRQLVRDAATFADTVAEYALHVARGVADESHGEDVRNVVARWFEHGGQVRAAAYRNLHDTGDAVQLDMLADLAAAPLLRCEPVTSLDDAFRAFGRLRRLCHAQAVGDIRSDVTTLRGFVALGHTITGHAHVVHAAIAAGASQLGLDDTARDRYGLTADRYQRANASWGRLHAALGDIRDAGGAPVGWSSDVLGIREQLGRLIRRDHRLLPPEELVPDPVTARSLLAVTDRLAADLPGVATGQQDCARRLYRAGQLYVPTRQLESADIPRLYAPIPGHRIDELLIAYDAAAASTRDAHDETAPTSFRRSTSQRTTPRPALLRGADGRHSMPATEAPVVAR